MEIPALFRHPLTFGSTINQRLKTMRIGEVDHINQSSVDPSSRFDTVKATYHKLKLHIVLFLFILDLPVEGGDLDTSNPLLNKGCRYFGL